MANTETLGTEFLPEHVSDFEERYPVSIYLGVGDPDQKRTGPIAPGSSLGMLGLLAGSRYLGNFSYAETFVDLCNAHPEEMTAGERELFVALTDYLAGNAD